MGGALDGRRRQDRGRRRAAACRALRRLSSDQRRKSERTFQMIPRLAILAGEPASRPSGAMSDAGLGRIGPRLDVAEEGCSVRPHRWQLSTHVAAGPQTVIGRQSFGGILVARRGLAGPGERFRRFRRAVTARRDGRVAIGDVKLCQSSVRGARAGFRPRPFAPTPSAISIALPRWAIASWKAERRSAWSPALPHHSMARSSRPASVK